MELFWKAIVIAVIAVLLSLTQAESHFRLFIILAASIFMCSAIFHFFQPVLDFFHRIQAIADMQNDWILAMLRMLGVGLTSEIAGEVCTEAGNGSISKLVHILGAAFILNISIPIYTALLDLLQSILGEL